MPIIDRPRQARENDGGIRKKILKDALNIFFNNKKLRFIVLFLGVAFHFLIHLAHGLFSFFFAIGAALILYLAPLERGYTIFKEKHN
jgi:hypothetical protein